MFDLDLTQWRGCRLLDFPAEPASFVAEAIWLELEVVGRDVLYGGDVAAFAERGKAALEFWVSRIAKTPENYLWDFFESADNLQRYRVSLSLLHPIPVNEIDE